MIQKQGTGTGFEGLVRYVFDSTKAGHEEARLFDTNLRGPGPADFARELEAAAARSARIVYPAWHIILSFPEGERAALDTWSARRIPRDFLALMDVPTDGSGNPRLPYLAVRHREGLHLVVCRVPPRGNAFSVFQSHRQGVTAARVLGERLGLGRVDPGPDLPMPRLTRGELEQAERLVAAGGPPPPKFLIAARIRRALAPGTTSPEDYREALARLGVELAWRRDEAGTITGSTYALPGYRGPLQSRLAGRTLGGAYSWARVAAYLEHGCAPGAIRALARGDPYPEAGMAAPGADAREMRGIRAATRGTEDEGGIDGRGRRARTGDGSGDRRGVGGGPGADAPAGAGTPGRDGRGGLADPAGAAMVPLGGLPAGGGDETTRGPGDTGASGAAAGGDRGEVIRRMAERLAIGALLRRDGGTAEASIRAGFLRLAPGEGDGEAVVARALLFLEDRDWAARIRQGETRLGERQDGFPGTAATDANEPRRPGREGPARDGHGRGRGR